jgi:hypothetical protein
VEELPEVIKVLLGTLAVNKFVDAFMKSVPMGTLFIFGKFW